MEDFPNVSFLVKPKDQTPWLLKKRDFIERKWNRKNDGQALLRKIINICNMSFPKCIETINVTVKSYMGSGGYLGLTDYLNKPNEITLFVRKRDSYSKIRSTLCHELIHSLCWCNTKSDGRRTVTSYFADMFADELLTIMLAEYISKGSMSKIDYEWALDCAKDDICQNLKNLKRSNSYQHVLSELELFLKYYLEEIKRGSNFQLQRQKVLEYIRSPNDC